MINQHAEILVVTDSPGDMHFVAQSLTQLKLGRQLLGTANSSDALDFIFAINEYESNVAGGELKLVLLDLENLTDGFEVLKQVKGHERTKHIPIVILTASKNETERLKAYSLGANSYITRQVQHEQFAVETERTIKYWLFLNQSARTVH